MIQIIFNHFQKWFNFGKFHNHIFLENQESNRLARTNAKLQHDLLRDVDEEDLKGKICINKFFY